MWWLRDDTVYRYLPLVFFTPENQADSELLDLRYRLLQHLSVLYRETELEPRAMVGPIQIQRLMASTADHFRRRYRNTNNNNSTIQQQTSLDRAGVDRIRQLWFQDMDCKLPWVFKDNLFMRVVLHDALSGWHIAEHLKWDHETLAALLTTMENYIVRSTTVMGESVGITAGQSVGEPLTQDFLGMFKSVGQKSVTTVAGDQSSLLSAVAPDIQLSDTLNASRREMIAYMTLTLKPPYNTSYYAATMACQQLTCRRLLNIVKRMDIYKEAEMSQWPEQWARDRIDYQHPDIQRSLFWCPTVRLEFDKSICETVYLTMGRIARDVYVFFKDGIYTLFESDRPDKYVLYLHFDFQKNSALIKRVISFGEKHPDLKINYEAIIHSVVIRCLHTIVVSGIPQVSSAYPIELSRYVIDTNDRQQPLKRQIEWAVKTKGSNMDAVISYPFIKFETCTTTFIHDVKRMSGINGARVCCQDSLDTIIRSVSKMAYHHMKLMADVMTYTGYIVSFTRTGLKIITKSPLHLAGFEEIMKNIYHAATDGETDHLTNVMSTVMVGNRAPVGTAVGIELLQKDEKELSEPQNHNSNANEDKKHSMSYRERMLHDYREKCKFNQRQESVYPMDWPFYNLFAPKKPPIEQGLVNIVDHAAAAIVTGNPSGNINSTSTDEEKDTSYFFSDDVAHHRQMGADTSLSTGFMTTDSDNLSSTRDGWVQRLLQTQPLYLKLSKNSSLTKPGSSVAASHIWNGTFAVDSTFTNPESSSFDLSN